MNKIDRDEFIARCLPVIEWLCSNCHPHVSVIITPTNAELLEGVCSTGNVFDFVKD